MQINSVSVQGVTSAVWSAASRTLSTLINHGITTSNNSGTLAVGATLDLRPPALQFTNVWIIFPTVAPGDNIGFGLYDGTTITEAQIIGSGGTAFMIMFGNAVLGPAVKSHASVGTTYVLVSYNFA